MDNELATQSLVEYVHSNKTPEIMNVTEDDTFIYCHTTQMDTLFLLRAMGYETWYQETKTGYHVRILKPNYIEKKLREELQKHDKEL